MNVPTLQPCLSPELTELLATLRPKANSLIVSVFGDAIMPRGGTIWLGDLVRLMGLFGLSERHVRTGIYRLSREGWLFSESEGRRARYSLSEEGFGRFEEASLRIYAHRAPSPSERWTLVQGLANLTQRERRDLRRTLKWLGFGQLSTSLMALPSSPPPGLAPELEKAGLSERVLVFESAVAPGFRGSGLPAAAKQAWPLDELNADYEVFIDRFGRFAAAADITGENAFALRTLLIHEYRRIFLKDPHLPDAFVPDGWAGPEARTLGTKIYRNTAGPAECWLSQTISEPAAAAPPAHSGFWQRFGGIEFDGTNS